MIPGQNFDDTAARYAADADRSIDRERARRNDLNLYVRSIPQAHDRAFAVVLFDRIHRDCSARLRASFVAWSWNDIVAKSYE